jgi:hypothetical protein
MPYPVTVLYAALTWLMILVTSFYIFGARVGIL